MHRHTDTLTHICTHTNSKILIFIGIEPSDLIDSFSRALAKNNEWEIQS